MKYYGIVLYERLLNGALDMYEETALVVDATSKEEAQAEVLRVARERQDEYKSYTGDTVAVVFKELVDVEEILCEEVGHGCPVFSRTFHDLHAYTSFIKSVVWR